MVRFTLNGAPTEAEKGRSLLSYLREEARLTGTHKACGEGACGACSVLVGIRFKPFPLVAVDIGVPFAYGPDGSRYVSTHNQDTALQSRLALAVKVTLAGDF